MRHFFTGVLNYKLTMQMHVVFALVILKHKQKRSKYAKNINKNNAQAKGIIKT